MSISTALKTEVKQILTLAEIKAKYPDQWVLVIEPDFDEDLEIIRGEVVYNTPDKEDLYEHLYLSNHRSFALEYTGESDQAVCLLI